MDERPSPVVTAIQIVIGLGLFAALIFLPAGKWDWTLGWAYVALMVASTLCNLLYLKAKNPAVIAARSKIGKGTKGWDFVFLAVFAVVMIAIYVVAGLDERHGWSNVPLWTWPIGCAQFALGDAMFMWPMGVNPFFEKTVRIQEERGHHVIDTGPYQYVRHPGYVGFGLGWILATPLLLGSWWAYVPVGVCLVALVARTALEDRTLQAELPGYAEYAQRVRYRLIPGLW